MAKHKQEIPFEEVVARGDDLDVHKKEIVATVSGTGIESETRTFQSATRSLTELKEWLLALGVTHVPMESTGEPILRSCPQEAKSHKGNNDRMCVVRDANKRNLLLGQIQEACIPQREETRIGRDCRRDAQRRHGLSGVQF